MIPHLVRVLGEYDNTVESQSSLPNFRREIASAVLAASMFSDSRWKTETVARVRDLLKDDDDLYLNACIAHRESVVFRMSGKLPDSTSALVRFVHTYVLTNSLNKESETNPRYNAQRGKLTISYSLNLIRGGELKDAERELQAWKPLNPDAPLTLEKLVCLNQNSAAAKILRYQGKFKEALTLQERILKERSPYKYSQNAHEYIISLSFVADMYTELGRAQEVESLIQETLNNLVKNSEQNSIAGRHLQISLAESYLERSMFSEARTILLQVKAFLDDNALYDQFGDSVTFQVLVGLGRVCHRQKRWSEAVSYWNLAEEAARKRQYSAGLVKYSMAHALRMSGDAKENKKLAEEAREMVKSRRGMFWITRFQSAWYDYIVRRWNEGVNEVSRLMHISLMRDMGSRALRLPLHSCATANTGMHNSLQQIYCGFMGD
ncbi:hypothetical protein PRK78_007489 [Emydomyces testavorans]|uniref:Uncharacterized protein n=1 Tax=Emydomyces testavorans TaxID=2070801 RepID=A0AAF0DNA7_9EURO|nr:hypothetical protein PRK78_007489 [Emydomyces testavorans]